MNSRPQPIIALDVPSLAAAQTMVGRLGERVSFYKVGLQLFAAEGPRAVEWLHASGKRVFLDLKLHDIPSTVARAAESARRLDVALLTIHGLGGEAMVRAAVEGAGDRVGVLVVTVLTSMDAAAAGAALGRPLSGVAGEVTRLASLAATCGAHGVVCGGAECAGVVAAHGDALAVLVPGVRFAGDAANDQARVSTPAEVAEAGARYMVVGRAVTGAPDPAEAYERMLVSIA